MDQIVEGAMQQSPKLISRTTPKRPQGRPGKFTILKPMSQALEPSKIGELIPLATQAHETSLPTTLPPFVSSESAQAPSMQSVHQTSLYARNPRTKMATSADIQSVCKPALWLLPPHNTPLHAQQHSPHPQPYGSHHKANQQRQDSLSDPEVSTGASYQDCYQISLEFVDNYRGSRKADQNRARQAKNAANCRERKRLKVKACLAERVCIRCKDRKRRCSKELPSCSACTRLCYPCNYDYGPSPDVIRVVSSTLGP
jgi:hypothetical protein